MGSPANIYNNFALIMLYIQVIKLFCNLCWQCCFNAEPGIIISKIKADSLNLIIKNVTKD